jgi:hypothetical protein
MKRSLLSAKSGLVVIPGLAEQKLSPSLSLKSALRLELADFRALVCCIGSPDMRPLFFLAVLLASCGQAPASNQPEATEISTAAVAAPAIAAPAPPSPLEQHLRAADYAAYAVAPYAGTKRHPDFTGAQRAFRNYRTALREGVDEGPNFAGRFALVQIGCGTNCRKAYLVNVSSGETVQLLFDGRQSPFNLDLFFRSDSALLNAVWWTEPSRQGPFRCIHETYVLREEGLVVLGHAEAEGECPYISHDDPARTGVSGDPTAP